MKEKIIVGLSGGVDSSVAAFLLLEQGFEVEGLFMKNWEEDDAEFCTAKEDLADATQVADKLGIKLHTVNFSSEYWEEVFSDFVQKHKLGLTPNPDVLCNQKIKFKVFLDYALELGANKIATGHYAKTDGKRLLTAFDENKDQTYFLHLLNEYQLSKSLFPLGDLPKSEVKEIAKKQGFITANKKESMGICFIGKRNFDDFLSEYIDKTEGDIIDNKGNFIKKHHGAAFYTIGQRKGLEIGGGFGEDKNNGQPWFVVDKNIDKNQVIVAQGENELLYNDTIITDMPHFINNKIDFDKKYLAKIRHRGKNEYCKISKNKSGLKVVFDNKQRAITPGQSIVFYSDEAEKVCLGGAIIKEFYNQID
jgi:tRNA-specific 2-thiouridylase